MAVSAQELSVSGACGQNLDQLVSEQITILDTKLLRSERRWGRNVLIHVLPQFPVIPGMTKADAQRVVYSSVIRSLESRGFETRISLEDRQNVLYVAWDTLLGEREIEAMNTIIRHRRVAPGADLAAFLEGNAPGCQKRDVVSEALALRRSAGEAAGPDSGTQKAPPVPPPPDWFRGGGNVGS